MVAYNFQSRFADQVAAGTKRQTIRKQRKRHARPGEAVQLYHGLRTKVCRKLVSPDPVCLSIEDVAIWVPRALEPARIGTTAANRYVTHEFAAADGFESVEDFTRFWFDTHGPGAFTGVLIRWRPGHLVPVPSGIDCIRPPGAAA